jgi:uncharacterized protein
MIRLPSAIAIYVDADACPVKDEVYRIPARHGTRVLVVANSSIQIPRNPMIERIVVGVLPDAAGNWIAARVGPGAIVITADIPLAARSIKVGACVMAPNGRLFTDNSIGIALATRDLTQGLRESGTVTAGPRAFSPRDRSNFLSALDLMVVRLKRKGFGTD